MDVKKRISIRFLVMAICCISLSLFSTVSYSATADIGLIASNIEGNDIGNGFEDTGRGATFTLLSKREYIARTNPSGLQNIEAGSVEGYQDITNYFELDNHYSYVSSLNISSGYDELNNYLTPVYSSDVLTTYQIGSDIIDAVPNIVNGTPYNSIGSIFSLITTPFNLDPAATRIMGAGFDLSGVGWIGLMTDYALNYSFELIDQQSLDPVAEFDVEILVPNEIPSPADLKVSLAISRDDLFPYDGTKFGYLKLPEIKNIRVYVSAPDGCTSYGFQDIADISTWYYKEYASSTTSFPYNQYVTRYDGGLDNGQIWLPADKFIEITLKHPIPFRCPGEYMIFVYGDVWWGGGSEPQEEQKILAYTSVNVGGHSLDEYGFSETEGSKTNLFNSSLVDQGVLSFDDFWDRFDWEVLKVEVDGDTINSTLVSSGTGDTVTGSLQNGSEYLLIGGVEKDYSRIFPWPESSTLKARVAFHFKAINNLIYTGMKEIGDLNQYLFIDPLSENEKTIFYENSSSDCYECNGVLNITNYSSTKNIISLNDGCTEVNFDDDMWMSPSTWLIYDNSDQGLNVSFNKVGLSFLSQYFKIFSNGDDSFTINGFGQDGNKYWYVYGENNIFNIGTLDGANKQIISNLKGILNNMGGGNEIYIEGTFNGQINNIQNVYVSGEIDQITTSGVDNLYLNSDFQGKSFDTDSKIHLKTDYSYIDNHLKSSLSDQINIESYHEDYAFTGFETGGISSHYRYENILYDGSSFWLYKDYVSNDCLNRMNDDFQYTLGSGSSCGRDIVNQIGGSYTNGGDIAAFGSKKFIIANGNIYEYNYDYSTQISIYDMSELVITALAFDQTNAYILDGESNTIKKFDLSFNYIDSRLINLPPGVSSKDLIYISSNNYWLVYADNGYLYKLNSSFTLYPDYENKYYVGDGYYRFAARGNKIYGLRGVYDSYIREFNTDFVKTNSVGTVALNTFEFPSSTSITINDGFPDVLNLYNTYSGNKVGNAWIDKTTGNDLFVCQTTINSVDISGRSYKVCNDPVEVWSNGEKRIFDYIIVNNYVNQSPEVKAPTDITVAADSDSGTSVNHPAIQNFLNGVTATDPEDGDIEIITNNAPSIFPIGTTKVIFAATDSDGDTSTTQATVTVTDQTSPVVSVPSDITVLAVDENGTPATNEQIAAFLAGASATDNVDGSISVISNDAPDTFPLGKTTVTFSATDNAGNTGTAQASITISDQTAPVVSMPSDIIVPGVDENGTPATNEQIASFLAGASATDNVDGSISVISNNAPGTFPLGKTTVTFSATDNAGNTGTAQASVTISDQTAPVVSVPSDITVPAVDENGTPASNEQIASFLSGASATDNVDGSISVISNNAPGTFPLGKTTVTFSATDNAGNTGAAQASVTISDQTAPVISVPSDITVPAVDENGTPASNEQIASFLSGASATDNVDGSMSVISNDAPGTFPLGETTVTFSATDNSGNVGFGYASITVGEENDIFNIAPIIQLLLFEE